jgi:hypothetical protein
LTQSRADLEIEIYNKLFYILASIKSFERWSSLLLSNCHNGSRLQIYQNLGRNRPHCPREKYFLLCMSNRVFSLILQFGMPLTDSVPGVVTVTQAWFIEWDWVFFLFAPVKSHTSRRWKWMRLQSRMAKQNLIYEISWILAGYCLKSKNSLKRDDTRNIQACLSQIKKSQSHSINHA